MTNTRKNLKPVIAAVLAAALSAGLYANGGQDTSKTGAASTGAAAARPITWWLSLNGNVGQNFVNLGDTPFAKGLQERTGVTVQFQHPPAGGASEQFNLLIADGNYPDLMEWNWLNYPGGPEKALSDGVIIPLNDVIEKYCPNLKAFLKAHPDYDRMIRTDTGQYYCFPMIRDDPKLLNSEGLMIRKDWLDDLGLAIPETMDEWHAALTAFKEKKNAVPFTFEGTFLRSHEMPFVYPYGTIHGRYIGDDGKVHLGQADAGYREFLATMRQWYAEGLIDPDFLSMNDASVTAKITGGKAGASLGYMGYNMGRWIPAGRTTDPGYTLAAAPMPVLRKGDTSKFSPIAIPYNYAGGCVAITTSCKNIETVAKMLDWGYGEAGHLYYNFGTEGKSYNLVNGQPVYSDWILNNPDGWSVSQAMGAYIRANYNGPFVQDVRYIEQYLALPEQKNALSVWSIASSINRVVPSITPTPDESREYATIMTEVDTYVNEMIVKFILGTEPLNDATWNTFVSTLKGFGIDQALTIENAALDRYKKR